MQIYKHMETIQTITESCRIILQVLKKSVSVTISDQNVPLVSIFLYFFKGRSMLPFGTPPFFFFKTEAQAMQVNCVLLPYATQDNTELLIQLPLPSWLLGLQACKKTPGFAEHLGIKTKVLWLLEKHLSNWAKCLTFITDNYASSKKLTMKYNASYRLRERKCCTCYDKLHETWTCWIQAKDRKTKRRRQCPDRNKVNEKCMGNLSVL